MAEVAELSELETAPTSPSRRWIGMGWLALLAVYLFWGSTYLAIRVGVETIPPLLLTGQFYVIAAAILFPFVRGATRIADRSERWQDWRSSAIAGVLMILGGNGLLSVGEVTLPAGIAALVAASVPLWLVVLDSVFVVRRRPPTMTVLGLVLGLAGVAILARPSPVQHLDLTAIGLVFIAAGFWAAGSLYSKRAAKPGSPFLESARQMLAGGIACLLAGLLRGEAGALHPTLSTAAAIAWLALPGSVVGFTSYVYALKMLPTSIVATYAFVSPIVAVVLGTLLLHERLTAPTLTAMVVILFGVALILRPGHSA